MSAPGKTLQPNAPAADTPAQPARGWLTRSQATMAFVLALAAAWPLLPDFTVVVASNRPARNNKGRMGEPPVKKA